MDQKKALTGAVSDGVAATMFVVAASEFNHSKSLSEIHLITSAPLSVSVVSSTDGYAMDFVQHSTIIEAIHKASVPEETELRFGGLTYPSSDDTKLPC